jgi:H/ACA ribonucleoprotein complex subunit 1
MVRFARGRGGFPRSDRGGRRGGYVQQEPGELTCIGEVIHPSEENTLVCKSTVERVPYFNKPACLESGGELGKVDEILGPINDFYFSVKCEDAVKAESVKPGTGIYIGANFLFPLERFTNPPKPRGRGGPSRGGPRGGPRGGMRRGGPPGGRRGDFRGGARRYRR